MFYHSDLRDRAKPLIGTHWDFVGKSENKFYLSIDNIEEITSFLEKLKGIIHGWLRLKRKQACSTPADWREAWHPDKVQVWGRIGSNSKAIYWFHKAYTGIQEIKQTPLTGELGQIGRIWHRMYPRYQVGNNGKIQNTGGYVELLTIFPDMTDVSETTGQFLQFLPQAGFTRVW